MTQSTVFLGALETHRLVGREGELNAIYTALFPTDANSFQYLRALLIFNAHTYPIQNDRLTFEYGFHAHENSLVNTIKCS